MYTELFFAWPIDFQAYICSLDTYLFKGYIQVYILEHVSANTILILQYYIFHKQSLWNIL